MLTKIVTPFSPPLLVRGTIPPYFLFYPSTKIPGLVLSQPAPHFIFYITSFNRSTYLSHHLGCFPSQRPISFYLTRQYNLIILSCLISISSIFITLFNHFCSSSRTAYIYFRYYSYLFFIFFTYDFYKML